MTQDPRRLAQLVEVAELQWHAWSQALAIRTRDERAAAAAVRELAEQRTTARAEADQSDLPAMRALETWEAWSVAELGRRSTRQAADRAALMRDREGAAAALARLEAARKLADRAAKDLRHRRAKRAAQLLLDMDMARRAQSERGLR